MKLVVDEAGVPGAPRWYVEAERVITSRIGVIETLRASARHPHDPDHRDHVLEDLEVIELDASIGRAAGAIEPAGIRTLDAIHLASASACCRSSMPSDLRRSARDALEPGDGVGALATYDARLARGRTGDVTRVGSPRSRHRLWNRAGSGLGLAFADLPQHVHDGPPITSSFATWR